MDEFYESHCRASQMWPNRPAEKHPSLCSLRGENAHRATDTQRLTLLRERLPIPGSLLRLTPACPMNTTFLNADVKRLEIPGRVRLQEGNGELLKVEIDTDFSEAELYLQGAHITEFSRKGEAPLLFTSHFSRFEKQQAIRGGVPVIFPWFAAREGEPFHGFARISQWRLNEVTALPAGGVSLRLALGPVSAAATWPPFTLNYVVTVTDTLRLELIATNTSADQQLSFEDCLHTYFHVGDIHGIKVQGLKGVTYLDKVDSFAAKVEQNDAISITGETDRVYQDTTSTVEISDPTLKRRIRVEKAGSASTVLWNPWIGRAQQMPDFGNEEYLKMVCVESGNVGKNRVILPPGKSHVLSVVLSSHPL